MTTTREGVAFHLDRRRQHVALDARGSLVSNTLDIYNVCISKCVYREKKKKKTKGKAVHTAPSPSQVEMTVLYSSATFGVNSLAVYGRILFITKEKEKNPKSTHLFLNTISISDNMHQVYYIVNVSFACRNSVPFFLFFLLFLL